MFKLQKASGICEGSEIRIPGGVEVMKIHKIDIEDDTGKIFRIRTESGKEVYLTSQSYIYVRQKEEL